MSNMRFEGKDKTRKPSKSDDNGKPFYSRSRCSEIEDCHTTLLTQTPGESNSNSEIGE